ncbi:MAG: aminotransferase class IV [Fimbriiglobus sp.]
MIAYLNGDYIPQHELHLSYADAGFVYGATITDYCRTYAGKLFRHDDHARRFLHDCQAIGIHLDKTIEDLEAIAYKLLKANRQGDEDLAVITFATPGLLPAYTGINDPKPTLGMHTLHIPEARYEQYRTQGVKLMLAGMIPSAGIVPMGIKHRSRLAWWLVGPVTDHVPVLLTPEGIGDTAIGAIVAIRNGVVSRPPRGTVLESVSLLVLEELCQQTGLAFREEAIDLRTWNHGTLMLSGSGFGLAPVVAWNDKALSVSDSALTLMSAWQAMIDHFTTPTR